MDTPISVAHPRFADLPDPSLDGCLVRAPGLVVERGGVELQGPTSPAYQRERVRASDQGEPAGATGSSLLANELSPDDVLQHFPIQRQVGDDLFQATVLVLKRLQPPHLVRQQPAIPLLPVEIGRLADPRLAADLGHRRALIALLQDERLLRLREPRCFHRSPLLSQPGKVSRKLQFQTVQFSGGRAVAHRGLKARLERSRLQHRGYAGEVAHIAQEIAQRERVIERAAEQMRKAVEQIAHANIWGEFFAAEGLITETVMLGC